MRLVVRVGCVVMSTALLMTCTPPSAIAPDTGQERIATMIANSVTVLDSTIPALRFEPPPIYAFWRAQIQECSGHKRSGEPTFWVASRVYLNVSAGTLGMFVSTNRRILLGLGNETVDWIVRHEILHDELDLPAGVDAHPAEYFIHKCGTLVHPPNWTPPPSDSSSHSSHVSHVSHGVHA